MSGMMVNYICGQISPDSSGIQTVIDVIIIIVIATCTERRTGNY